MFKKFSALLVLALISVSCGDINSVDLASNSTSSVRPIPAFSAEDLSTHELTSLQSLCSSFQNMTLTFGAQHQFNYTKDYCSETQDSYTLTQSVAFQGVTAVYTSADPNAFFFPEIRFDTNNNHVLATYCNRIGSVSSRFNTATGGGIKYTLEVLATRDVSGQVKDDIRNVPGCYDSTMMLATNAAATLICVRIWADQTDAAGTLTQNLTYETATFAVSNILRAHSGFTVHREKHNYVQCTDKKKSLVYKATRLK